MSWSELNGIIDGIQETEKAMEGVAILLNNVCQIAVVDFGCVSLRILCIKFKFSKVKVYLVVGYSLSEGDSEERESYWNDLNRIVDRVGNEYRLCVLGDLNIWIGDRVRVGKIPGQINNGRRKVEFCAERGCV